CKGTPGRVCLVPDPIDFCIAQDMVALRADPKIVYNKYLLAVLRSFQIQEQILSTSVGDVIPHFKKSFFDQIMIPIPNMDIQKSIGDFYYTISEKTELNKKINDNLEQQAATYFQELFINNANPMWQISTISDLGTVVGGSTPSKTKPEYYTNNGIAWITPKDLSINKSKFISHGENDITELGLKNSSATVMPKGTVLFSSRAPIGYIAIASNEVTTNQGFKSVIPYSEIGTAFVYFFLKHSLPVIESAASGSTFKEISGSAMKNIPAIIPDRNTLDQFNSFCAPIFAQQKILEEQNHSLAMLRDSLLPKLMSGAIDIASIQI
ncbi:restriction endonuclease subunit S, partial [Faecalibacterium prausnitzii]